MTHPATPDQLARARALAALTFPNTPSGDQCIEAWSLLAPLLATIDQGAAHVVSIRARLDVLLGEERMNTKGTDVAVDASEVKRRGA